MQVSVSLAPAGSGLIATLASTGGVFTLTTFEVTARPGASPSFGVTTAWICWPAKKCVPPFSVRSVTPETTAPSANHWAL